MSVDVLFELTYMLSDVSGKNIEVEEYRYDRTRGVLCVKAFIEGIEKTGCIDLKQCKQVPESKLPKCITRSLAENEKKIKELVESLEKA